LFRILGLDGIRAVACPHIKQSAGGGVDLDQDVKKAATRITIPKACPKAC
jgi:hypothetical protein